MEVVGTMVWDAIHGRGVQSEPVEEWGGISYALAGLEAALPDDWEIVPLIKVGKDLAADANTFLNALTHRSAADRFVEVPDPNNRVTLLYESSGRRAERLSGGCADHASICAWRDKVAERAAVQRGMAAVSSG